MDSRESTPPYRRPAYPILSPDTPAQSLRERERPDDVPSPKAVTSAATGRAAVEPFTVTVRETTGHLAVPERGTIPALPQSAMAEASEENSATHNEGSRITSVTAGNASSATEHSPGPMPAPEDGQAAPAGVTAHGESSTASGGYLYPVPQRSRVATPWPSDLPADGVDTAERAKPPHHGFTTSNNAMSACATISTVVSANKDNSSASFESVGAKSTHNLGSVVTPPTNTPLVATTSLPSGSKEGHSTITPLGKLVNPAPSEKSATAVRGTSATKKKTKGDMGPPPVPPPRQGNKTPPPGPAPPVPPTPRKPAARGGSTPARARKNPAPKRTTKGKEKEKEPDRWRPPVAPKEPLGTLVPPHPGRRMLGTSVPAPPSMGTLGTLVPPHPGRQIPATMQNNPPAGSPETIVPPPAPASAPHVKEEGLRTLHHPQYWPQMPRDRAPAPPPYAKRSPFSSNAKAGPSRPRGKRSLEADNQAVESNTRRKTELDRDSERNRSVRFFCHPSARNYEDPLLNPDRAHDASLDHRSEAAAPGFTAPAAAAGTVGAEAAPAGSSGSIGAIEQMHDLAPDGATGIANLPDVFPAGIPGLPDVLPDLSFLNLLLPGDRIAPIEHHNAYNPPSLPEQWFDFDYTLPARGGVEAHDGWVQGPDGEWYPHGTFAAPQVLQAPQMQPGTAASGQNLPVRGNTHENVYAAGPSTQSTNQNGLNLPLLGNTHENVYAAGPSTQTTLGSPHNNVYAAGPSTQATQPTTSNTSSGVPGPSRHTDRLENMSMLDFVRREQHEAAKRRERSQSATLEERVKNLNKQYDKHGRCESQ